MPKRTRRCFRRRVYRELLLFNGTDETPVRGQMPTEPPFLNRTRHLSFLRYDRLGTSGRSFCAPVYAKQTALADRGLYYYGFQRISARRRSGRRMGLLYRKAHRRGSLCNKKSPRLSERLTSKLLRNHYARKCNSSVKEIPVLPQQGGSYRSLFKKAYNPNLLNSSAISSADSAIPL